jgi:hypothetical protein
MLRISLALFCGLLALVVTGTVVVGRQEKEPPKNGSEALVGALRILNTWEVAHFLESGRFAAREEMLAFLKEKNSLEGSPINLEDPKPYELSITTTSDGQHYQIELLRSSDTHDRSTWCQTAGFSDERGVIYLGQALGCEEVSTSTPSTSNR